MPIRPPALDDRSFDDLVDELLSRIPAHTPEWTHPNAGDPGRTLIELFAWLGDTLLYRANLIPERQRLAFLRLLGVSLRPAVAAQGLVSVAIDDKEFTDAVSLAIQNTVKGAVNFETRHELMVLPVTAEAYGKRPLTSVEAKEMAPLVDGLVQVYGIKTKPKPYVTTPVFANGAMDADGWDMMQQTVDGKLWLALLAAKKETVGAIRTSLGRGEGGASRLLNIGVTPSVEVPALFEEIGARGRIPHVWEISTGREIQKKPEYLPLTVLSDGTAGLRRQGVIRVALPSGSLIGAPPNDVRVKLDAGLGDRPPRLDDPKVDERLVTWIRLRPLDALHSLPLSWVGINAVEVDQRQTITGRVVGQSDGTADQQIQLPGQSVEPETLIVQVEEQDRGYIVWQRIEDLATAGRDDSVYTLDSEAGVIRFGDGVRGRIPPLERRVRVERMRAGGGSAGNLPPGSLKQFANARDITGAVVPQKFKIQQSVPTAGGEDAEDILQAERRIPALFRHRDRAVTADDYRRLANETPGVRLGRVEVLPKFKPQQRRTDEPGVVSVMVLPYQSAMTAPNPRPDRPLLEAVHEYLSLRRPLATELYVIGCEYVPLALTVGISIREGSERDTVLNNVRETIRMFLWSLAPGGPDLTGWPLERAVRDREIEVAVARVAGVGGVSGVNLFTRKNDHWNIVPRVGCAAVAVSLASWQLPELLGVLVVEGDPPNSPDVSATEDGGIAVPVVPEVC